MNVKTQGRRYLYSANLPRGNSTAYFRHLLSVIPTYEADTCKYTLISAMKKEVFFVKIVSTSLSVNIIRRIHTPSLVYQQYLLDLKQHVFHSSESNNNLNIMQNRSRYSVQQRLKHQCTAQYSLVSIKIAVHYELIDL